MTKSKSVMGIAWALVVVLLIAGFWFLADFADSSRNEGLAQPDQVGSESASAGGQEQRDLTGNEAAAEDSSQGRQRFPSPTETDAQDSNLEKLTPSESSPSPVLTVKCVDAATRSPVGLIDVYIWTYRDFPENWVHDAGGLEAEMHQFGQKFCADAQGFCQLPITTTEGWIGALSDTYVGRIQIPYETETTEVILELKPRRWIDVRVVDHEGRSLGGAEVELVAKLKLRDRVILRAESDDEQGAYRFPLDLLGILEPLCEEAEVVLGGFFEPKVAVSFAVRAPPFEPITLVMPAKGGIRATLKLDKSDRSEGGRYWMRVEEIANSASTGQSRSYPIKDNTAMARQLELGRRYKVRLEPTASANHWGMVLLTDGPRNPDEVVDVVFDLRGLPRRGRISGRLLTPEGTPIRDVDTRISVELERKRSTSLFLTTDQEGSFVQPLPITMKDALVESLKISCSGKEYRDLTAEWRPKNQNSIDLNLGDITMQRLPASLGGYVVDDLGNAVEMARIAVADSSWNEQGRLPPQGPSAYSAEDGSFALYGLEAKDTMTLVATKTDFLRSVETCAIGSTDLRLVLRRHARLRAKFLAESDHLEKIFFLQLMAADESNRENDRLLLSPDGVLDESCHPGSFVLELRSRLAPHDVVWRSRRLDLRCGETTDLGNIRIEQKTKVVNFSFVRPPMPAADVEGAGWSVAEGRLQIVVLGQDGQSVVYSKFFSGAESSVAMPLADLPATVLVNQLGYRLERVLVDQLDVRVELQPGIAVDFEIGCPVQLPAGYSLEVQALMEDKGLQLFSGERISVEDSKTQRVRFPHGGTVQLELVLIHPREGQGRPRQKNLSAALNLNSYEVVDQEKVQSLSLHLNQKILETALAGLR